MNYEMLELLKGYFNRRKDIAFAFLFGSAAKDKVRKEGDVDIAVYFWPEKDIEWEVFNKTYPSSLLKFLSVCPFDCTLVFR